MPSAAKQMTRTYEGRVPAKALVENGTLWVPIAHHIEGVFENRDAYTSITFAQAEGDLAESTLSLAQEFRELQQQANRPPEPGDCFSLEEIPSLPPTVDAPMERGEWQFYWHGSELMASRIPSVKIPHPVYYRLTRKAEETTLQEALSHYERAVVSHGHLRIRLKKVNQEIRDNIKAIKHNASIGHS